MPVKRMPKPHSASIAINKGTLLLKQNIGSAEAPLNWFNRSPAQGAEGVAAEDTYYKFGLPTNKEIIVCSLLIFYI
jgi:hypothetical protein